MAKAKVVHSEDAVTVLFEGSRANPEPHTAVIKFPGGHVEVSRTSDGTYWAHTYIEEGAEVVDSRLDYKYERWVKENGDIPDLPAGEDIQKMAVRVGVHK